MNHFVRPMTRIIFVFCILGMFFLVSSPANAQFKRHGLGITPGFQMTFNQAGNAGAPAGSRANKGYGIGFSYFSIGIEYALHLNKSFGWVTESHVSMHSCGSGNISGVCSPGDTPIMLAAFTGVRWYFLNTIQDDFKDFRPHIGIAMGYWQSLAFVREGITSFGPALDVGADYYIVTGDSEVSLGFRFRYGMKMFTGAGSFSVFHGIMAGVNLTAYL